VVEPQCTATLALPPAPKFMFNIGDYQKWHKLFQFLTFPMHIVNSLNIKFAAGAVGAKAALRYGSGSSSIKMMQLLAALAPQHHTIRSFC
jgi:hypothetical protein